MLASELLRRLVPVGSDTLDVRALGDLLSGLLNSGRPTPTFFTADIDLTAAAADYALLPPSAHWLVPLQSPFFWITQRDTPTVAPTLQAGTNAGTFNNLCASQTPGASITQAVNTRFSITIANPIPVVDLAAAGLGLRITNPATATALRATLFINALLVPQ